MESKENIAFAVYFGVFIVSFFVIMIILFVVIYQRKRIAKENEYFFTIKDKELQLLRVQIETQELEREKIARNIHDEIGPLVSALKMHLSKHENALNKGTLTKEDLIKERKFVDVIMKNIRHTSMDLSPQYLLKDGLDTAIDNYIHGLSGLKATFVKKDDANIIIENTLGINIYRIILELCNNIVKHANPSFLMVELSIKEDSIFTSIEHDGEGLNNQEFISNMENSKGIGLNSLKSRITLLGATLNFQKDVISKIELTIPIDK